MLGLTFILFGWISFVLLWVVRFFSLVVWFIVWAGFALVDWFVDIFINIHVWIDENIYQAELIVNIRTFFADLWQIIYDIIMFIPNFVWEILIAIKDFFVSLMFMFLCFFIGIHDWFWGLWWDIYQWFYDIFIGLFELLWELFWYIPNALLELWYNIQIWFWENLDDTCVDFHNGLITDIANPLIDAFPIAEWSGYSWLEYPIGFPIWFMNEYLGVA